MLSEDRIREICISKIPIIKRELNKYHTSPKRLWIYGAGISGIIVCNVLEQKGVDISGFIDNRAEEIKNISDKKVVTIDKVNPREDFILISLRDYDSAAVDLCKEYGFSTEDIYYLFAGENFNRQDIVYKGCKIGRYTYGYENLLEEFPLAESIGRFCSFSRTARVWNNHPLDYVTTHPFLDHPMFYQWEQQHKREDAMLRYGKYFNNAKCEKYSSLRNNSPVIIENDVWIGANAIILPGVHIANGAIIAAGGVVTRDVEPYAIVGGSPARVIRYRYNEEQIEQFQEIKWWDWDIQKIEENYELFYQPEEFLEKFALH